MCPVSYPTVNKEEEDSEKWRKGWKSAVYLHLAAALIKMNFAHLEKYMVCIFFEWDGRRNTF